MGLAEEYLNNLTDDVPTHSHVVTDTNSRFVIDPDTRKISFTGNTESVLIQYDHNSEVYSFELPRYIDGHDMMLCNRVYVHYNNIDGKTNRAFANVAEMTDLRVSEDDRNKVVSSWTISRAATQFAGTLNFLIQYMCVEDGETVYEWHTDIYDGIYVNAGRKNNRQAVAKYSDVLEEWHQRLFGTGDSVIALTEEKINELIAEANTQINFAKEEIMNKAEEALDSIPSEYTELHNYANEAARTKGDAVTHIVDGEVISVDDSSDDYLRGLRVFGNTTQVKTTGAQLITYPYFDSNNKSVNGVKWTIRNDGSIFVSGTATSNSPFYMTGGDFRFGVGSYTISGSTAKVALRVDASDISTGSWVKAIAISKDGTPITFTITEEDAASYTFTVYALVESGNSANVAIYPMLNTGSKSLSYEPYTGVVPSPSPDWPQDLISIDNPVVYIHNKNLLNVEDKNISTSSAYYYDVPTDFEPIIGETYTLSADAEFDVLPCLFSVGCGNRAYHNEMNQTQVEVTNSGRVSITFTWQLTEAQIASGYTKLAFRLPRYKDRIAFNAKVSNIQLELGTTATEYEPYKREAVLISHTLPAIPVSQNGNYTDENGQQWICDEVDFERGVYVQRVNSFNLTDVGGTNNPSSWKENISQFMGSFPKQAATEPPVICTHGDNGKWFSNSYFYVGVGHQNSYIVGGNRALFGDTVDSANAYLAQLNAISPIIVQYVLATPIETPLTTTELQTFKHLCSNYHNTTVINDANAWMELKYNVDTELFIKNNLGLPTDEQVNTAVDKYLDKNPVRAGMVESDLYNGVALVDRTTNRKYVLYIDKGKLTMEEGEV